jgi:ring-1,2-phenylacetyl-CoA epoxidase subunit PaaE
MQFYKLLIKEIKRETKDAVSILFNIPKELKQTFNFIAGQYVTVKLTLDGNEIRRAYSICSSPNSGELRIAVKAVKNGVFSQFANQSLQEGDLLEVSQPEGKFIYEAKKDKARNFAAFVAGSGITPVSSILKNVLEEEPNSSFVLVYGNKTEEDVIFKTELEQLQKQFFGRLTVHYAYSQINVDNAFFGRIDKSVVLAVFNKHQNISFDKFYLCGPEDMINTVSGTLKEKNISEKDILFELFSTSKTEIPNASTADGHTQVTLVVDNDTANFEMSNKQTILEAALKQGLDVPYSCQGGICSSCICRISEGSATMLKNQILTDNEIAEGLVLACQAIPTTNAITVDFDNI